MFKSKKSRAILVGSMGIITYIAGLTLLAGPDKFLVILTAISAACIIFGTVVFLTGWVLKGK